MIFKNTSNNNNIQIHKGMTNEQTYKFAKLTKALFRMIFEPIYGASVDFATDYGYCCIDSIKYIILTHDNKNDYYDEKDWVGRISFSCTNSILINTNHPYYEDIKDKVHDFVTEVEQYI